MLKLIISVIIGIFHTEACENKFIQGASPARIGQHILHSILPPSTTSNQDLMPETNEQSTPLKANETAGNSMNSTTNKVVTLSFNGVENHDINPGHIVVFASIVLQKKAHELGMSARMQDAMFNDLQKLRDCLNPLGNPNEIPMLCQSLLVSTLNTKLKGSILTELDQAFPTKEEADQLKNTLINISTSIPILATTSPFINYFCCFVEELSLCVHLAARAKNNQ